MHRPVIIVDPVSSGSHLAPAFSAKGIPAIAIRSTNFTGDEGYTGIQADHFLQVYDNQPNLVEILRHLNPRAIIAGAESGVKLADKLAAELTPALANIIELSRARWHKAEMQKALEKAGLPVIRTLNTASINEVTHWLADHQLTNTALVLKPPASSGSDKVFHIPPGGDWKEAFDYILSTPIAFLGESSETVIVQEQVIGTEYAVDTVSANGNHALAHLIRYQKTSAGKRMTVFDYTEFMAFNDDQHGELLKYTKQALDALGIRWGAAHSEIMLTPTGPRLIETGARMCGGPVLGFARAATGSSQLERVIEAYTEGEIQTQNYAFKQTVVPVFLISPVSGILRNIEVLDKLHALPTHLASHFNLKNGDYIQRTVDFNTNLGVVALAGEHSAVFADYTKVREIEAQLQFESKT